MKGERRGERRERRGGEGKGKERRGGKRRGG